MKSNSYRTYLKSRFGRGLTQVEENQAGAGSIEFRMAKAMHLAAMQEMRNIAAEGGWPGPDIYEHPEGYEGPCFCEECRTE
jgi:hypothetical protein